MTIHRYYALEASLRIGTDHEFPAEVRSEAFLQFKGDTTASDLVLEEIRQLLESAGYRVESIGVGLIDYRVIGDSGEVLQLPLNEA